MLHNSFKPFILVSQKLRCTNFGLVVKHMLTKVEKCENLLHVSWKDSTKRTYPLVWLRDNCQCEKCFHPESKSRTLLLKEFDTHPAVSSCKVLNGTLSVAWSDGHKSAFNSDWLLLRGFDNESQRKRSEQVCSQKILWNSGLKENLPRSNFFSAINENESLVCWLKSLQKYGVAILENAPCKQGQVRILAHKIGFIKKTHYGEEFQVQAKDQPNNVAYTSTELQLHTDLPYYEYKPGVNILHCIAQDMTSAEKGENQLVDGFAVAENMRDKYPDAFKLLATTLVDWSDVGVDDSFTFNKVYRAPVFCQDITGQLIRINYSQPQRDSYFPVPLETVQDWYDALKLFCTMLYSEEYLVRLKLKPGDILIFDNRRVVHGRSGFGGGRHVEGAYIDWDEINSRLRVLESGI